MRIFATYLRIYFLIMSCILNIETSTDVCSVAISDSGQVIFNQEDHTGPNHAVKLGVFVDEALDFLDSHGLPLEAVAVSCGPGSYTGLRIGVSMAKGICYGRGVKLIAVPTLELMAVQYCLANILNRKMPHRTYARRTPHGGVCRSARPLPEGGSPYPG